MAHHIGQASFFNFGDEGPESPRFCDLSPDHLLAPQHTTTQHTAKYHLHMAFSYRIQSFNNNIKCTLTITLSGRPVHLPVHIYYHLLTNFQAKNIIQGKPNTLCLHLWWTESHLRMHNTLTLLADGWHQQKTTSACTPFNEEQDSVLVRLCLL